MAKKTVKLDEEAPKKPQELEEILQEGEELKAGAEATEEEEAKEAEEEAKIPEVEVDLDAEREKTKQEAIEAVTKDVVEPLKKEIIDLKETLTKDEKDDYDKFVDDYTEKNGKAPEWKQVATFLEERAVNRIKDEQKAQEEASKQAESEAKQQQEDQATQNFKFWQGQLEEMEKSDMLPKMEKPEQGDPGFDARVQLYGLMANTWNKPGIAPLTNLYEVHAKFGSQINTSKQPPGADAPVSMGEGGSADDGDEYSYAEVHQGAQDLETFAAKELAKAGAK